MLISNYITPVNNVDPTGYYCDFYDSDADGKTEEGGGCGGQSAAYGAFSSSYSYSGSSSGGGMAINDVFGTGINSGMGNMIDKYGPTSSWMNATYVYGTGVSTGVTYSSISYSPGGFPNINIKFNSDPSVKPGPGFEWVTQRPETGVGSDYGSWYNPLTGESFHPDFSHQTNGIADPHYDYSIKRIQGVWKVYEDGTIVYIPK